MQQPELILPGNPLFDLTLGTALPFDWREVAFKSFGEYAFVCRADNGILEAVPEEEAREYLYGGEYDERLNEIGEWDDSPEPGFIERLAPVLGIE